MLWYFGYEWSRPTGGIPWVDTHSYDPATASAVLYGYFAYRGFRSRLWRSLHPRLNSCYR